MSAILSRSQCVNTMFSCDCKEYWWQWPPEMKDINVTENVCMGYNKDTRVGSVARPGDIMSTYIRDGQKFGCYCSLYLASVGWSHMTERKKNEQTSWFPMNTGNLFSKKLKSYLNTVCLSLVSMCK